MSLFVYLWVYWHGPQGGEKCQLGYREVTTLLWSIGTMGGETFWGLLV